MNEDNLAFKFNGVNWVQDQILQEQKKNPNGFPFVTAVICKC